MKPANETSNDTKGCQVVFVLIDGLADVAIPSLKNQTPLEAANTPAMDAIAQAGLNGLMDPVEPGLACGSDTAHMSIFGYDPRKYYRGRGSFEAIGAGLEMENGDIAFKCNFATVVEVEGSLKVTKRRVDRNFPSWGIELCSFLNGMSVPEFPDVTIAVKYATEHRCGIVLKGPGLCDRISGTDPLKDNLPLLEAKPLDNSTEAIYSSKVLNAVSKEIHRKLSKHSVNIERVSQGKPPGNIILLRGPGEKINVMSFQEMHGLRPFMIAPTCIIAGLGQSLGMDLVKAPGATGDYHSDLNSKAITAIRSLSSKNQVKYDFGFVHVKAVDDAGHDADLSKKISYIEKSDRMIASLISGLYEQGIEENKEFIIVVTGDHTTPVLYGDHTFEPVPFTIARVSDSFKVLNSDGNDNTNCKKQKTDNLVSDRVHNFSEMSAFKGYLGRFPGSEALTIIKQFRKV